MAEESGQERTEEATPRRRQKAVDEGQFPRSQDLTIALSLLGCAMVLRALAPGLGEALRELMGESLAAAGAIELTPGAATALFRRAAAKTGMATLLLAGAIAAITFAIAAAQARGTFTAKPLQPKLERLSPAHNAKRIFSARQLVEMVKSVLKLLAIGGVAYVALRAAIPETTALAQGGPFALLDFLHRYIARLFLWTGIAYLALGAADYGWQWWQHEKSLRMTREELKQEFKEDEGDPHVKGRRREIARSYAQGQMLRDVARADVVVTNPTHIAVAILFDPEVAPVPIVLAMGQELVARRIRELAHEAGVPVIENKPLARALWGAAAVGTVIPPELWAAVAEVLGFVYRARGYAPAQVL
ncbi:MAG: hypothetical protein ABS52_05315 [Gemmatimonadetes bacterium SCN 70-22]|nr:MAG: hypothetical protein ABS52_05315 [Gemmatimonadetes bacterium SCN 70-22]